MSLWVQGPLTRSAPTTCTGTNARWVIPPELSSLLGRVIETGSQCCGVVTGVVTPPPDQDDPTRHAPQPHTPDQPTRRKGESGEREGIEEQEANS